MKITNQERIQNQINSIPFLEHQIKLLEQEYDDYQWSAADDPDIKIESCEYFCSLEDTLRQRKRQLAECRIARLQNTHILTQAKALDFNQREMSLYWREEGKLSVVKLYSELCEDAA